MKQIYRRTPMLKCDFNFTLRHGCSPVNLLHIFRTPFPKNTSEGLLWSYKHHIWSTTKKYGNNRFIIGFGVTEHGIRLSKNLNCSSFVIITYPKWYVFGLSFDIIYNCNKHNAKIRFLDLILRRCLMYLLLFGNQ